MEQVKPSHLEHQASLKSESVARPMNTLSDCYRHGQRGSRSIRTFFGSIKEAVTERHARSMPSRTAAVPGSAGDADAMASPYAADAMNCVRVAVWPVVETSSRNVLVSF